MKRNNIEKSRTLRKNQTVAEQKLWGALRNRQLFGVKFRRQFPIDKYILDFYSPEYKLGIEADGGQHYEDVGRQRDELRAKELFKYGIRLLRFSDLDILNNIDGVCEVIFETIKTIKMKRGASHLSTSGGFISGRNSRSCGERNERGPSPLSSPQRGEEVKKKSSFQRRGSKKFSS